MNWVSQNLPYIGGLLVEHIYLALVPVVLGLLLSIPIGWLANRRASGRVVLLNLSGLLYTVPSIALFVLLPAVLGTTIRDPIAVLIALTLYTLALLVRTVADGLSAVPQVVVNAATAMGYAPLRRFLAVELPMAVPVILAGLRVAAVSSISIATVSSLVGFGGLGQMFTDGFRRANMEETVAGIVLVLLLALVVDGLILLGGRALTPWDRAGRPA